MTLEQAYEKRRLECLALQREVNKLTKTVDELRKGTYVDAEKAAHIRTINRLTQENKHLKNECERYRDLWKQQVIVRENIHATAAEATADLEDMKKELQDYKDKCQELQQRINTILKNTTPERTELLAQIDALKDALLKERAKADTDSTNSSLPTSKTPIGKKKHVPNSRVKSEKKRGGQVGHAKHALTPLSDEEITDTEEHTIEQCPDCGSESLTFLEKRDKDVLDYEVRVIKKRHVFYVYQCDDCGHVVHSPIPLNIKEPVQYGSNIQALALALTNVGFVSVNRTSRLIESMIKNSIHPSEGFICKLQKRASAHLRGFVEDARLACINSKHLYWDDTVIFINTTRACMRFYGNENVALFKAHAKKDRAGIDEDAILGALSIDTIVMHDHVVMNYNDDFYFRNVECNQHLERDLQGLADISFLEWPKELKRLIAKTIHDRKQLIRQEITEFSKEYISQFHRELDKILSDADIHHAETVGHYYENEDRKMISRLRKFRDNYFAWLSDFSIPVTNNLSERQLRPAKLKQKVSGQYLSVNAASYFADIRTYIQTCRLHDISEFDALSRLTRGSPYTLQEIM